METLSIRFKPGALSGRVLIPGSKSISNRLLVMAYLAGMDYHPDNLSTADDTVLMQKLLGEVAAQRPRRAEGAAPRAGAVRLDCANAGTVLRFLTALLAFEPGEWLLDGSPRMRRRPIGPLVTALQAAGADIRYGGEAGYPPLRIRGVNPASVIHKIWDIDASLSSQYVSALMLAACRVPGGVRLRMAGEKTVSKPYIRMTAGLLCAAGMRVDGPDGVAPHGGSSLKDASATSLTYCTCNVGGSSLKDASAGCDIRIGGALNGGWPPYVEPDWSSASYFYGLLALGDGGDLFLPGLRKDSCQGDSIVAEWFEAWGIESRFESGGLRLCRREKRRPAMIELDFTHQSDLLQTMAVVCAGGGVEARFTGIKNLRYKETDRVTAVVTELNRLGFRAEVRGEDEMTVAPRRPAILAEQAVSSSGFPAAMSDHPQTASSRIGTSSSGHPKTNTSPLVHTYGDHRMALAFSMLAVLRPVLIENPAVVKKSFDTYWASLASLGAEMDLR